MHLVLTSNLYFQQQVSGPSAGSSRASLRSASIVSSVSPPESLKEEEDDVKEEARGLWIGYFDYYPVLTIVAFQQMKYFSPTGVFIYSSFILCR